MLDLVPTAAHTAFDRILSDPFLLVGAWILIHVVGFVPEIALRVSPWDRHRVNATLSLRTERINRWLGALAPSRYVRHAWANASWTSDAPEYRDRFGGVCQCSEDVPLLVADTVGSHLLVFGIPFAGAILLGVSPIVPVAAAVVVRTLLARPSLWIGFGGHSALLAGLWLAGAWPVALALVLGNNLLACGGKMLYTSTVRGRRLTT